MVRERNLTQPGHQRYQAEATKPIFGHDNHVSPMIEVMWAVLETYADIGFIPKDDARLLTPTLKRYLLDRITMTMVEELERKPGGTDHDIGALVLLIKELLPPELRPFVHLACTSEDVKSTATALMFRRAHVATKPLIKEVVGCLGEKIDAHATSPKLARTHGQHAVPFTFGAEFAPIIERMIRTARTMDRHAYELVGKISGAVGTYNAQIALGIPAACGSFSFEKRVLAKVGLPCDEVATQLVLPETLAEHLNACTLFSGAVGQLGRLCRHLMRSEIGEVYEEFRSGQVGSSAMPHKRNPKTFEQLEGMSRRVKNEYANVLDTLVSDEQRDLVGSSQMRMFAAIPVLMAYQLETLTRKDEDGRSFLGRMRFDTRRALHLLDAHGALTLAEPIYAGLARAGYGGNAHRFVSKHVVPLLLSGMDPWHALIEAERRAHDPDLTRAFYAMPESVKDIIRLGGARAYIGDAERIARRSAQRARTFATSY